MALKPDWYVDLLRSRDAAPPASTLTAICEALTGAFEPRADEIENVIASGFGDSALLHRFLLNHAESERAGAHVISAVARRREAAPFRAVMLAHAEDEDRHDRMLAALADLVAGRSGDTEARPDHSQENADFLETYTGDLAGFICDLHVAEIRSHYFLTAYSQAAAASRAPYAGRIKACFDDILLDEENHISYTAALIGRWSAAGRDLGPDCQAAVQLYAGLIDEKLHALRALSARVSAQA